MRWKGRRKMRREIGRNGENIYKKNERRESERSERNGNMMYKGEKG